MVLKGEKIFDYIENISIGQGAKFIEANRITTYWNLDTDDYFLDTVTRQFNVVHIKRTGTDQYDFMSVPIANYLSLCSSTSDDEYKKKTDFSIKLIHNLFNRDENHWISLRWSTESFNSKSLLDLVKLNGLKNGSFYFTTEKDFVHFLEKIDSNTDLRRPKHFYTSDSFLRSIHEYKESLYKHLYSEAPELLV